MARDTCPSCGAAYNGRRCRNCLYEPFSEEIAHGNHTHKGEPLVIGAPARKPVPQKDPFGCDKKSRKRHPLTGFILLLVIINSLLPLIRNWGLELEAREEAVHTVAIRPEPEPVMAPEDLVIFHQEADVTIFTSVEDFSNFGDGFCLYVEYAGSLPHVTVVAGDIQVNGCDMPFSGLVCKARSGEIGKGWLELDEEELEINSIENLQTLDFTLTALGSNGRALFTTDEIRIMAEETA